MQELNYLKDKVITPGAAPFVSHATYPVNDGHADLWLYDIFPGVQLMVTDFACETCFQDGMEQDVIGIHHCAGGGLNASLTTGITSIFERKKYGIQLHCDNFRTGCQTGVVGWPGFF